MLVYLIVNNYVNDVKLCYYIYMYIIIAVCVYIIHPCMYCIYRRAIIIPILKNMIHFRLNIVSIGSSSVSVQKFFACSSKAGFNIIGMHIHVLFEYLVVKCTYRRSYITSIILTKNCTVKKNLTNKYIHACT